MRGAAGRRGRAKVRIGGPRAFVVVFALASACAPATLGPSAGVTPVTGSGEPSRTADAATPAPTPDPTPLGGHAAPQDSVVAVDPRTGTLAATIKSGRDPLLLAVAGEMVWTLNLGDGSLTRIDPTTYEAQTVTLDQPAAAIAGSGDDLWVAVGDREVVRLSGSTGELLGSVRVSEKPAFKLRDAGFLTVDGDVIWMTIPVLGQGRADQQLWAIDATNGQVAATYGIGPDPRPPVVGGGAVWVAIFPGREVYRLDLASRVPSIIDVPDYPSWLAYGAGAVWVGLEGTRSVARLASQDGRLEARIRLGANTRQVAFGDGWVWAATEDSLAQIDPSTNSLVREFRLTMRTPNLGPSGIAVLHGLVWVSIE